MLITISSKALKVDRHCGYHLYAAPGLNMFANRVGNDNLNPTPSKPSLGRVENVNLNPTQK